MGFGASGYEMREPYPDFVGVDFPRGEWGLASDFVSLNRCLSLRPFKQVQ